MFFFSLTINCKCSLGVHNSQLVLSLAHVVSSIIGFGSLDRKRRLSLLIGIDESLGRVDLAAVLIPGEFCCGVTRCDVAGQCDVIGGHDSLVSQSINKLWWGADWKRKVKVI